MKEKIGFWEAFSIGVGGMIGGGIFAVLGLSIQLSKGAAPLAFLLAGFIALTTAYSYAKLSLRFPSEGGTIEYLVKAYGTGLLSGTLNVLLLASYIVMIALYAYAFGSYGANLLPIPNAKHIMISIVIIVFTMINALGAVVSGRTEDLLVAFKLAILFLVVGAGIMYLDLSRLSPSNWADPVSVVAGGMIIFLAYEGFELIANTAHDVENPSVLPKAFYSSVILVIAVYVLVAIVTVGTLPYDVIMKARDYALAMAAEPSLGKAGFLLVTFAALASTSSAINATLYGTARASYMVAKYGQLPEAVEKPVWRQAYEGLLAISILALILANTVGLESISTAGSGGFLLIFLFVNFAALKLRRKIKANPIFPIFGVAFTLTALAILVYRMAELNPSALMIFFVLLISSLTIEILYRKITGRRIETYLDRRLKRREESIRSWREWIDEVAEEILRVLGEAEVYVIGGIARGDIESSHDVDVLVVADRPVRDLKIKDVVHLHFVSTDDAERVLRKVGKYIRIR